jgi:hypothetical protein
MASLGNYQVDVDNTTTQGGAFELMPDMYAKMEVTSGEVRDTKDTQGKEVVLVIDVLEPEEFKGRKLWAYWTISHGDPANKGLKRGKPLFDRLCRAVGVFDPQDTDDILFKSFTGKLGTNLGGDKKDSTGRVIGKYDDKNEIKHFYYPDADAPEPTPEPGVITTPEGKAEPTKPANDNKPAAAAAAAPKKTPWGTKK